MPSIGAPALAPSPAFSAASTPPPRRAGAPPLKRATAPRAPPPRRAPPRPRRARAGPALHLRRDRDRPALPRRDAAHLRRRRRLGDARRHDRGPRASPTRATDRDLPAGRSTLAARDRGPHAPAPRS